jgi:hypothetical protein
MYSYSTKVDTNFIFFEDEIPNRRYIPSIRPNLIKRFLQRNPHLSREYIFFHDTDIIFREVPQFLGMQDNRWHLANTNSYINHSYLETTGNNAQNMCNIVGIDLNIIIQNNENSGGAQYFGKNNSFEMWDKIEKDSEALFRYLEPIQTEERLIRENGGKTKHLNIIQAWTAGMWAELWNIWLFGNKTVIDDELSFSTGTGSIEDYYKHKIFHNAGVEKKDSETCFYKGSFYNTYPFDSKEIYKDIEKKAMYFYLREISDCRMWLKTL